MWIKSLSKGLVPALFFSALSYLNIASLHSALFGWSVFVFFLWWTSKYAHLFLIKYFNLSLTLRIRVISIFFIIAILGFVIGMLSWFFKMTPGILVAAIFFISLVSAGFKLAVSDFESSVLKIEKINDDNQVILETPALKFGVISYLVLIIVGFYLLNVSRTGDTIFSPWQAISPQFIYIFFVATLLLGFLIFSKLKSSTMLFLLVLHTILLHAYLPLTHDLFYGADGWRHMAIENNMLSNIVEKNLAFTIMPENFWQRFNFGGLAYAQFNSLAIMFKMLCQLDFIVFLKYFISTVWSLVFPILLYEIALVFGWEKKRSLFFVWLSMLPFALQVSGSFSLPSNLSFLVWLFLLLLQLKNKEKLNLIGQLTIVIIGLMSVFGHSLYFILFCLSFVLFKILNFSNKITLFNKIKILVTVIFSIILIPAIELLTKFSEFDNRIDLWAQFKLLICSLSGWYVGTGLRSSDITVGNIVFNQPPINTLVSNIFVNGRFAVFVFMLLFWISVVLGIYKIFIKQKFDTSIVWFVLTVGLYGGYIISRYFMKGENILSRRLDAVLAVLIILPVAYWLYEVIMFKKEFYYQKITTFSVVLVFSLAITTSYALGPDGQTASVNEYLSANYIWQEEQLNTASVCVLSDLYTSLILEGLSGNKIVGGGFPMNLYFNQSEKNQLWKMAKTDPTLALSEAKKILKTNSCYLVGDFNLPYPTAQFGDFKIYKN